MTKKAMISGITGQDGSYLAEFLLNKGYEVHGLIRRTSLFNTARILHLFEEPTKTDRRLHLHYAEMADSSTLARLVHRIAPDEIYNLAAQSHVKVSFDMPEFTGDVVGIGALRLLEAIRETEIDTRFYQASSSELYGKVVEVPQTETTPFYPRSPYAVAKLYAYWMTVNYREAYNLFACNGILFNHESPRRGETFVTRKITRGLAQICAGQRSKIHLGNLDAKRDWGYAADYVRGMWMMLQADRPDDYVLATGKTHSVREFLQLCCRIVNLDPARVVEIDPRYFRPTEVDILLGDPTKAKEELGWSTEVDFEGLARIMMSSDLAAVGIDPRDFDLAEAEPAVVLGQQD